MDIQKTVCLFCDIDPTRIIDENKAREKTLGLWAVPAIPPWEYRKKN